MEGSLDNASITFFTGAGSCIVFIAKYPKGLMGERKIKPGS
jgi:hypothetical protein